MTFVPYFPVLKINTCMSPSIKISTVQVKIAQLELNDRQETLVKHVKR